MSDTNGGHNDNPPMDDYGIRNDEILQMCDFAVKKLFGICNDQSKELGLQEIQTLVSTLDMVWNLTQSILNFDEDMRDAIDDMNDQDGDEDDEEDGEKEG
jgi:hypothetical protein